MESISISWRRKLIEFIESPPVERFIILLIVINSITLGLETSRDIMASYAGLISMLDKTILTIFVLEIGMRIVGHGRQFFKDPWSLFDFFVVGIALLPAASQFSVLRALRVLRVLRLISMVPEMRRVVTALLAAIPGLSSIIMVLVLIFYVFAVIATNLFAAQYPEWFGSIGHSMYTLFQIMTLESWSMGIVRPLMETHPYAWAFFIPFILIATFTMLNLFIAIIVNAMQTHARQATTETIESVESATSELETELHKGLERVDQELRQLRRLMEKTRNNSTR